MFLPSPHNFSLPPDWRWQRAAWLREKGKHVRSGGVDDEWTKQAKGFQIAEKACRNDLDRHQLERKFGALFWAREMANRTDLATHWLVEALFLARCPLSRIASLQGVSEEVLAWYEKLFFSVLDRIDNEHYIYNIVMGRSIHEGLKDRDYDLFWKLVGYCHGTTSLLDVVRRLSTAKASHPDQLNGVMDADIAAGLRRQAVLTTLTTRTYGQQAVLLEGWSRLRELEQEAGPGGAEAPIKNALGQLLGAFNFRVGLDLDVTIRTEYAVPGVEPRAAELLESSLTGRPIPAPPKQIEFKFPQPAASSS